MKNPNVSIPVIAVLLLLGIIIFKNWNKWFPKKPKVLPDGTPCNYGTGVPIPGTIKNGVCVPIILPPPVEFQLRKGEDKILVNNIVNSNSDAASGSGTPDTLLVRVYSSVMGITFKSNNCTYKLNRMIIINGIKYAEYKLISCP